MLTRLKVNGFKNLIDVNIPFGPFTCIAGANGVGKSNLFDAILFLKSILEYPIIDSAMKVRDELGKTSEIKTLFTQTEGGRTLPIEIEVEMLAPKDGVDYLDQPAQAKTTFLTYKIKLEYREPTEETHRPRIEIIEETLDYVKKGVAKSHLPFDHSPSWRDSVVVGRRTSPYISTEAKDNERFIKLHQDSSESGGRARLYHAAKLPRTVLSTVNSQESPTAVLARQEILSWKLLQLEPTALRSPDGFDAPAQITHQGGHLPSTLYRLFLSQGERVFSELANRLSELTEHIGKIKIDKDEKRELLTLMLTDKYGTELPAKSLSDGTLRFLALASVEIDPSVRGLVCMEEPENGIHPERITPLLELLQDIAVDTSQPVTDDNPLRQVIINTHSPVVVQQVPDDTLIFASPETKIANRRPMKGVTFRCLTDTWRSDVAEMPVIKKGNAIAYLNPIALPRDTSKKSGERRVMDRLDLQLAFDL